MNIKDYFFWESIKMDFVKLEAEHFDKLDNATLKVFKDYYYPYRFWIDLNLRLNKIYNTTILKAVAAKYNNK